MPVTPATVDITITAVVMIGPGGIVVEQIMVQRDLSRPPRQMLRVRRGSYYVADCRTVEEVGRLVDLATLEVRE